MLYAVGSHIDFSESKKEEPVKEKYRLYVPGTHVIFCLIENTIQVLEIKLAGDKNLLYS